MFLMLINICLLFVEVLYEKNSLKPAGLGGEGQGERKNYKQVPCPAQSLTRGLIS